MCRLSLALLLLSLAGSSFGDDGAWSFSGGAGNFTRNDQIRMTAEEVFIHLHDRRSHVHAEFTFQNEGPATKVTMAFPEESHNYPPRQTISVFSSRVDNLAVHVTRLKRPAKDATHWTDTVAVWLKQVAFKANQTRRVEVDYWMRNGDIGDYVENGYILTTGATWKGRIGKATITVDWSDFHGRSEPLFGWETPAGNDQGLAALKEIAPRRARLFLQDFEPRADLTIRWTNAFWNFSLNGMSVPGFGYGDNRERIVRGPDSDPRILATYASRIFSPSRDKEAKDPVLGDRFVVAGHIVQVLGSRTVVVDGRKKRLRRDGGHDWSGKWVYVRDLVQAMGGRCRYRASIDRMEIQIEPESLRRRAGLAP